MIWPFRKKPRVEHVDPDAFAQIENTFGPVSTEVRASVPHFLLGGHVDLRPFANETGWTTNDVRFLPDFPKSGDGHPFELFTTIERPHPEISALLTVLVRHFSDNTLYGGDRVFVAEIAGFQALHPWVRIDVFDVGRDGIALYQVKFDAEVS